MTDRIMHINFKPQDMQLVRESLKGKSYANGIRYDNNLKNSIGIDLKELRSCDNLCDGISGLMIDIIKFKMLKNYIWKTYTNIDDKEKDSVFAEAEKIFFKKRGFIKENIYNKIYDFFIESNNCDLDEDVDLDIDGFLKFRMKDFNNYVSIISDIALEEHLIKRDKREFLDSLKYFINIQEEKMEYLRITITKDGLFLLSDEYGNMLEELNNQELINIAMEENLSKEDLLISAIMTLCPRRIEIVDSLKDDKSQDIIEMIKMLFEGRVKVSHLN